MTEPTSIINKIQTLPVSHYSIVLYHAFSSVQISSSVMSNSLQPHEPQHARPPCPSPTPGVHPEPIESMLPSNHLILCRPFLLLPSIFPSIRVFSTESAPCIRWPNYWSFSFNIRPSNEHPGLISFIYLFIFSLTSGNILFIYLF